MPVSAAKLKRLRQGEYRLDCPACKRQHLISQVGADKFLLNHDEDDDFMLVDQDADMPKLHPLFVCRNLKCGYEGYAKFERHAV